MPVSTISQATVEIRRTRLLGLVVAVAATAAAITWALGTYAVSDHRQHGVSAPARVVSRPGPERSYLKAMARVCSVVMCPPNERIAARLGVSPRR